MLILSKEEFLLKHDMYKKRIEEGAVFIYPTDTIYGLGCDARNHDAVKKIRKIKERKEQPFSVIAPCKEWIIENCLTTEEIEDWLEKLPGAYTFILNLDNQDSIANNVNPGDDSVGVRIPDNWFTKEVEFFGFPVVTTSVNISGSEFMTSMDNLDPGIKGHVDFVVYEGEKHGTPSKLVDFRAENIKFLERGKK